MITAEQARKISESRKPNILDKISTFFEGIDNYIKIGNEIKQAASNGYRYYIVDSYTLQNFSWIRNKLEKKGYRIRFWQKDMKFIWEEPIIDERYYEIIW